MSNKIDLPDNGWASLLTAEEISERRRGLFFDAQAKLMEGAGITFGADGKPSAMEFKPSALTAMRGVNRARVLAFVTEWSYGDVTEDVLIDLPGNVYDALVTAAGEAAKGSALQVDMAEAADPKAPTGSSDESAS